ncbi:polymorphic toxin type 50 domain-containing protein [Clostridium cochlearium]|uniref:polymorphic toxin type 50 domain-containing protein n=1 Tax=Clostridium cochlearium TaxID=1494 RepID=UPI000BBCF607|nr:polymorphic toxin type 50 domain-containing protein [Clostridium cochlearium]
MNEYLELVDKAQKQRIILTKKQMKNIRDLYRDVAKDLGKRAKRANKDSLSERWLLDYQKQFKKDIKELNKILRKDIEDSMLESARYANNIQLDFFNLLDIKYKLNSKETFSNMFSKIPQESLQELISGDFYKDGKGLSERLWFHEKEANANFDYIIQKGLVEKKSTYELAKDLSDYVNPEVKKDWSFKNIYPGVGNKKIEYNSFRLAVTSISHAYQLSMQRSCKANPFVEGIEWHTSNSHRGPCTLCQSREGKTYKPDELPLDHPNGVCYFTPVITKSMEDIGLELHDWLYGGSNSKLDDWYKEYGREFVGESNFFRNISKKDNNNDGNSDIINSIRNDIKSGKYPLEILESKQGKHIREHNNYIEGRSYLTISIDEAQKIVNKYAGNGIIRLNQNNEWDNKEIVTVDKEIGINVNSMTNEESKTNRCKIHYSKRGTHIVPTRKK